MKVDKDSVVSIEYTLTDESGNVLDRSAGNDPVSYVHGRGGIVPGLEKALFGKRVGDEVSVSVSPEDGYGAYDETLTFEVPRSMLPSSIQPAKGLHLMMSGSDGQQLPVTVLEVRPSSVVMDSNHPLAGKTLHYDVRVKGLRRATPEDLMSDCCRTGTCAS